MAASVNPTDSIHDREPVNILMVDDQPAKLLSYEAILRDLGENLVKASSVREALDLLLKQEFAMILLDVCMPEQDGFELVELIRQHPRFEKIPVIFISAVHLTDLDKHKGYASGAVDYVSVPVVPVVLRAKVAVFADLFRKTRDLARLNQDLETRVLSRTEELRKTQEALIETDKRKDQFLAMLAHELRNPLAPMQSSLELLRKLKGGDEAIDSISETLDRQLRQMTHLIADLMDVSRITRNKLELRKEQVPLATVINNALEMAKTKVENYGHELEVKVPAEEVLVHVDAIRVSQVVFNLLSNACKYTSKPGRIQLEANALAERVDISVSDNGIGLEPAEIENIFDPFFQVDRAVERSQGGLGIGLTLVRSIVEKHGGQVFVTSSGHGKGCKFEIQLPKLATDAPIASPEKKEESQVTGRIRLLVVDDNHDAAITLAKLLEHLGHEVKTCFDGMEACQMAETYRPEVILMDLGMPIMNGFEAAAEIRSKPHGNDIVLVALTGWGQSQDRMKSKEAGFNHHLVKPVTLADLERVLSETQKTVRA